MMELKNVKFKLVMNSDLYQNRNGVWIDCSDDEDYMKGVVSNAEEVRVVGIIRQRSTTANQQFYGGVYYTSKMRDEVIRKSEKQHHCPAAESRSEYQRVHRPSRSRIRVNCRCRI
ncbi:MAG: hypothetical protein ACOX1W_00035 [Catenisphaera adipataccumulans]|uniref:hypothetical protein n=1 Tax=Catenisphaera adipataccumulans TaxID=700500 RepID=UPI003D90ACEC